MKFPTALEFTKELVFAPKLQYIVKPLDPTRVYSYSEALLFDLPELPASYSVPGVNGGNDRVVCRTVGGLARLELLSEMPPTAPGQRPPTVLATAALMGNYAGYAGVIQQHNLGPSNIGFETTGAIAGASPFGSNDLLSLYTVSNSSAGAYGFDYMTSYSNLADSIFIRIVITLNSFTPEYYVPYRFRVKGVLLAGDPK